MATTALGNVLGNLRRSLLRKDELGLTDGELLVCIIDRDEAAFEAMVRRHGPMVLGVCRRILRNEADAEDAFQATFLVLMRRAGSIRPRGMVGNWLYGVAHTSAVKARAMRSKRRAMERQAAALPRPEGPTETWEQLQSQLDQELKGLPDKYRSAIVLCDLEGKSIKEAARQMACPLGTVGTRLARGRHLLSRRLARHALALSGGTIGMVISQNGAAAEVPAALLDSTVRAATLVAAGQTAASRLISAKVAALTEGVLKTMLIMKLKVIPVLLAIAALIGLAGHLLCQQASEPPKGKTSEKADSAKQSGSERDQKAEPNGGRILFFRAGHLTLVDADGKNEKLVSQDSKDLFPHIDARLSPDGKSMAFFVTVEQNVEGRDPRRKLFVRRLDEKEPGTDLEIEGQRAFWSPDGSQIVVGDYVPGKNPGEWNMVNRLVDIKTKKSQDLKLPENHAITDWSRDGKHFLTTAAKFEKDGPTGCLYLVNRDGSEPKALTDSKASAFEGRLSPDGNRVLYLGTDPERKDKKGLAGYGLFVLDIAKKTSTRVEGQPLNGEFMGFCWSPDSKRIVYCWRVEPDEKNPVREFESQLVVADADGKNAVSIASEKADNGGTITIASPDWR